MFFEFFEVYLFEVFVENLVFEFEEEGGLLCSNGVRIGFVSLELI